MKKEKHMKNTATTKENLEERFDAGEDVSDYFDLENATRRVPLDLPAWAIAVAEKEAARKGIPRSTLLKLWIVDKADELNQAHKQG